MKKLSLYSLLFFALVCAAQAQSGSTNACTETDVVQGGTLTWTSTFSMAIVVTPAPGTTWFLGQSQVIIPPNGSVTVNVPANAGVGTYNITSSFDTNIGGNPCGGAPLGGGGTVRVRGTN